MKFGKGKRDGGKKKFEYRPRSAEDVKHRAEQRGGSKDFFVLDSIKTFTPKSKDNTLRILPPTWDDAKHFGHDIFAHYGIGPDNSAYLCLKEMKGEDCPACDERARATGAGEEDLAAALKPVKRVAMWVIDREDEKEGPKLWLAPWTLDRDLSAMMYDKKTGEVLAIDDPEDGYDISFTREGQGPTTKYIGIQISRRSSPLSDDPDQMQEWLAYVQENPVPDVLVYAEAEALEEALQGGVRTKEGGDDKGKEEKSSKPGRSSLRPSSKPAKEEKKGEEDEGLDVSSLTWDDIQALDEEGLEELIKEAGFDEDDFESCKDLDEAKEKVCELLELEKPKKEKEKDKGSKPMSLKERLAAARGKK